MVRSHPGARQRRAGKMEVLGSPPIGGQGLPSRRTNRYYSQHNTVNKIFKNNYSKFVILIFLFIFAFRFYFAATHVRFGQDQARDVIYMDQFAKENKIFIGYGPKASVGNFFLPPFYYQIYYWFSLFTNNHPLTMVWITTIIEALTPVMLFLWLRYLFKDNIALPISVIFAFFFMPVTYGTAAWNPNMIPFFSTLSLYCWFTAYYKNKGWAIILGSLSLTISIHLHYQSIVLLPFAMIILILSIRKNNQLIKYWLAGFIFFIIPFIPYLYTEIQNGWQNTTQIYKYFTQVHSQYFDRVSKPSFFLSFLPSFIERVIAQYNFRFVLYGRLIFYLGAILMLIAGARNKKMRTAILYFITIFIMLRVYKGDKNDYYMSMLYIMPAFFLGLIYDKFRKIGLIILIFTAFQAGINLGKINQNNQLKTLKKSINYIEKTINSKTANFIFHDDNFINIFVYGMKQNNIKHDNQSRFIIDICSTSQPCNNLILDRCNGNPVHTYSSLIKNSGNYKPVSSKIIDNTYKIIIGKKTKDSSFLPKSPYHINKDVGSDLLLPINQ